MSGGAHGTVKKILITGGAGFIGSHLAKRCIDGGDSVTIVDNLSSGDISNVPEDAECIIGDISEKKTYRTLLAGRKFDCVLHLAAQSSGEISDERPDLDLRSNTLGTLLLLQWCKKQDVPRFLYASSMAVYGNPQKVPVSEATPPAPLSFYGISKMAAEHYIFSYSGKGLQTTVFRMFSVYGPGQDLNNLKQGMVSIFLAYLLKNEPVWVRGSRDRFRDFIYIDDVADAWYKSISNKKTYGKTYNLATGRKTFVHELIREEILSLGLDPDIYPVRYEGFTPADQFGLYADIGRIRKDLDWKPRYSLKDGLALMARWAKGRSDRKVERK